MAIAVPVNKRLTIAVVAIVAIVAVIGLLVWNAKRPKIDHQPYQTQPVSVGPISKTVSASGTLQALVTVDVGSQISGQLKDVLVDFDDHVVQGQVLARIDPQTQQSRVDSSKAELESAVQSVNSAQANLNQTRANADVTRADYNRTKSLFDSGIVAKQALEQADAKLASAEAQIQVQVAAVRSAQARLSQVRASLQQSQIDLDRTVITSPITGVVVDRKVDPGSTVAASFNAPVLFQIAQDLSKLELKILVDEADIGQVITGQQVDFTVDAFPEDNFTAHITQVRKQPETNNNVVTYVVIAEADNPDLKLLPGMTANAEIVIERHTNVIRAPSTALRWQPANLKAPPRNSASGFPGAPGGGFGGPGGFRGPPGGFRPGGQGGNGAAGGARRGGNPMSAFDQVGLTDEQLVKFNKILDEQRQEMQEIQAKMLSGQSAGQAPNREAMQKQFQELNAKYRALAEALLTDAQKAKLKEIQALPPGSGGERGQVYVLRDGKPFRIGVGIGATDGSTTQLISDAFKQGDVVIVGGGPQLKTK